MPELPEVELTRRRLSPDLTGKRIERVEARVTKLRFPLPVELASTLTGQSIRAVDRRGKYLLFDCETGWLIIHLGMTGFLRYLALPAHPGKHDHLDIHFSDGSLLRFHDPRKFGALFWTDEAPAEHAMLSGIGPEPLTTAFSSDYLFQASRSRRVAVKQFIMESSTVAGVGNIYANEALFRAAILPGRPALSLTSAECAQLVQAIREVLEESISQGSSYRLAEESVAYHPLAFAVYGREKERCPRCTGALQGIRLGNRSSVYCPNCQH